MPGEARRDATNTVGDSNARQNGRQRVRCLVFVDLLSLLSSFPLSFFFFSNDLFFGQAQQQAGRGRWDKWDQRERQHQHRTRKGGRRSKEVHRWEA